MNYQICPVLKGHNRKSGFCWIWPMLWVFSETWAPGRALNFKFSYKRSLQDAWGCALLTRTPQHTHAYSTNISHVHTNTRSTNTSRVHTYHVDIHSTNTAYIHTYTHHTHIHTAQTHHTYTISHTHPPQHKHIAIHTHITHTDTL